MKRLHDWLDDPKNLHRVHQWAMFFWGGPGTVLIWFIAYKLPPEHGIFALGIISNYANFVGHWGALQATRAEEASS